MKLPLDLTHRIIVAGTRSLEPLSTWEVAQLAKELEDVSRLVREAAEKRAAEQIAGYELAKENGFPSNQ